MTNDLELIRQLEKEAGIELRDISFIEIVTKSDSSGFAVDEKGQVIGLSLVGLKLTHAPVTLSKLIHLKTLRLIDAQLENISFFSECELIHLTRLDLRRNKISDISVLSSLTNLTHLYLWDNQISDISVLKQLTNLTHLYLWDNQISDISGLSRLTNLNYLNLSGNRISDISYLKRLMNLTWLDLSGNQISDISALNRLTNLKELSLNSNNIFDISVISRLTNLTRLDVRNNKISRLPIKILEQDLEIKWKIDFEGGIILEGNPLESPPIEIVMKGKEAINAFFRSLEGERQPLNEVKALLVGDGGAGKTSLMKKLLGETFDLNESRTHGINIKLLNIPKNSKKIRIRLWDFGGQAIMHSIHQFFLSKRSLYILVLDGRKEEDAEYWLKHIESFGGDSPVLVVINKIDLNPLFEVNRKFLVEKYPNIKGFYRVSCCTGEGIEDFNRALVDNVTQIPHLNTTWARSWLNVKKHLEKMQEDFISFDEYIEICEDENIMDYESQHTLVDFLNDLGVVLHFHDSALKETSVINPKWAADGVYSIINSRILDKNKGILPVSALTEILNKDYYPRRKHYFLIELMKKFELCFSLNDDTIMIPDLLGIGEPEYEFDEKNSFKFLIYYDFLPKSVIARFIVRMHQDIKNDLRWRTGVVLEETGKKGQARMSLS
jgi:small GTP-binding protein